MPVVEARGGTHWTLGSAGRLSPVKNFEFLIDVVACLKARYPNLRVRIAGEAFTAVDREYEAMLRQHIASRGMQETVSFEGFVHDIWKFMDAVDVFVLCSHTESFGRVVAEAMWSCKPVVVTRVGALSEIVEDGVTGFTVAAGDVSGAARILGRLIEEPEKAAELGRSARRFAEANLSLRSYVTAWRNLLLEFSTKR